MPRQHSHFEQLKNKWVTRHNSTSEKLLSSHGDSLHWFYAHSKKIALGSLAGMLFFANPVFAQFVPTAPLEVEKKDEVIDKTVFLIHDLFNKLPKEVRPLTRDEEERITGILSERFGMTITAQLEGKRLERNYGYIGQEQHLMRYPGDTIDTHFTSSQEAEEYSKYGMAPGRGAWGYFASSFSEMTPVDSEREKYYIAVQTFLSEGFNERFAEYRDFYKYRKMLVINPQNGKAIVADIADAGPAVWTGKSLGGSPEVMRYLERVDGAQKGPVLYFFIDDPSDTISLGPIAIP